MANNAHAILSDKLAKIWGKLKIRHVVLGSEQFIVYLDDVLDIEWKTTGEWDATHPKDRVRFRTIINGAARIETDDWDYSDERRTLNFKRQVAEAIACALEGDYDHGDKMLEVADQYRMRILADRDKAISDHVQAKDTWHQDYNRWTAVHYVIGVTALFLSTLVASKPALFGFHENVFGFLAWFVAFLTGVLTFLTPDKKAGKYLRAWSILGNQITRYRTDRSCPLETVLAAHQEGQSIITEQGSESVRGQIRRRAQRSQ
jgi:hypothetical protein